jgi:hypothetical protein
MKTDAWLVISAKKSRYMRGEWTANGVQVRKNKPATGPNEVAIKLTFAIPDAYFEVPELSASVMVPEDAVNKPTITPDVIDNFSEVLSEQLGVKVHVDMHEAGKDD